jgi:hypothetical protein
MTRPRWRQVQQFCRKLGYKEDSTTHWQYEKVIAPGIMSWTQISFGKIDEQIGSHLWKRVWHDQLHLKSEDSFWAGLDGQPVLYDVPPAPRPPEPLPAYLRAFLADVEHVPPERIPSISLEEAKARWLAYHSRELLDP